MTHPQDRFTLYYFHDPMCSWCWGFAPTWQNLQQQLPDTVQVQYVLGGLAPDTDQAMPADLRSMIQNTWRRIHEELGSEFNFDFWTQNIPRRATYPACRAVIAAEQQGQGRAMVSAIQHAYYLHALNPSDRNVLVPLGKALGVDETRFNAALTSRETEQSLQAQITHSRRWAVQGYPSLVLKRQSPSLNDEADKHAIGSLKELASIPLDYHHYQTMLSHIEKATKAL